MNFHRSRLHRKVNAPQVAEVLEHRTLLAAVVDSISIDGQAPQVLGEVNGVELLALSDDDSTRLFTSDGTQAGTIELSDIAIESISDYQLVGQNLFIAGVNNNQTDLWRTNGRANGAILVKSDISFSSGSETNFGVLNGEIYFGAKADASSIRAVLFKSDGGPATPVTEVSQALRPVTFSLQPDRGVHFEIWVNEVDSETGALVQSKVLHEQNVPAADTYDAVLPEGLYRYWIRPTDAEGNVGGWSARRTEAVHAEVNNSEPGEFKVFNDELYFAATTADGERQLWKTDGSTGGTMAVGSKTFEGRVADLVEYEDWLFFVSSGGLHRTDGNTVTNVDSGLDEDRELNLVGVVNGHLILGEKTIVYGDFNGFRLLSISSADDVTPEVLHVLPGTRLSRLDSFTLLDGRIAFVSVQHHEQVSYNFSPSDDRHLPSSVPRFYNVKHGTWYFSDGTAAGTSQAGGVPFVYSEDDFHDLPADFTLRESITVGDSVVAVDNDVALIDGDTVTRISDVGHFAVLNDEAIALQSYGRHLMSVTPAGVRQENAKLVSTSAVETLADAFWVAATSDDFTSKALYRIDLEVNSEPGPAISGLESPNDFIAAGEIEFSWSPPAGSPPVAAYNVLVQRVSSAFGGITFEPLSETTDTSLQYDFDPGSYRIRVRSQFEDGTVSLWSEVFLQVSEPTTPGPAILTTSDDDTVFYDTRISWATDPNAVSYETNSGVGLTTGITDTSTVVLSAPRNNSVTVRSRYADGTVSQWSDSFEFYAVAPPTPSSVEINGNEIKLNLLSDRTAYTAIGFELIDVETGQIVRSGATHFQWHQNQFRTFAPYSGRFRLEIRSSLQDRGQTFYSNSAEYTFEVQSDVLDSGTFVEAFLTGNQLRIDWRNQNAVSYDLVVSGPTETDEILSVEGITETSRVITVPAGSDQFYVTITSRDAAGASTFVAERTYTFPRSSSPSLRLTEGGGIQTTARPTFGWDAPDARNPEVVRYELLVASEDQTYRRSDITTTSHTVEDNLGPGRYRVFVRAHYEDGTATPWNYHQGVVDVQAPVTGPPQILSPAATVTTTRPVLGWQPDAAASHYEVWLSTAADITPIVHETDLNESSLTLSSDLAAGGYRLWVRTHYANGTNTKWTPTYRFQIFQHDVVQITSGVGTQPSGSHTIVWNAVANAESYEVYVNEVGLRNVATYRQAGITETSHAIGANLEAGKSYEIWVRAHGGDGTKTRWGNNPPILTVESGISTVRPVLQVSGNTASWAEVAGASQYELWVNQVDPQNPNRTITARAFREFLTGTSQEMGLAAGTYRGWIRAAAAGGGRSLWSEAVTFVIS